MTARMELTQNCCTSDDPQTSGFDMSAGKTWIYPENYPMRDYQFSIVKTALLNNTLVCLPTGLGKTFIAAVVMFNFWRWYPKGKIVFLAPTRPLVAQQINACYNIMGIPVSESVELTGQTAQEKRKVAWSQKRVIFATPQVFQKDLEKDIISYEAVKCVVIDEAHKALGKHSYHECIKMLHSKNQYFRVLALSATPGNKLDKVHEILKNLLISQLELRDDTSPDIIPYINERKLEIIVIPLTTELNAYKERYIRIMDRHVRILIQYNILGGQTANINKGKIFYLLSEFNRKTDRTGNYGQIIKTLNILLTMYHAYDLLIRHGLRAFSNFYSNHSDKYWLKTECDLKYLLEEIRNFLGPFPEIESTSTGLFNGDIPECIKFGHNKFYKLKEILIQHFQNADENTRAIVFVEYRDIVNEIYVLLLQSRPLIRPQKFVGQSGCKQRQQLQALEYFRNNTVNVLISTSIGEEGLDVGEVDLIICFDISQKSPIRLVQRMGRTGRKRDGHIIVLVTEGNEHEAFRSTMRKRDSINNKILCTTNIDTSLYTNNPRMVPLSITPECHKIHIIIETKAPKFWEKSTKRTKFKSKNTKPNGVINVQFNSNQSSMDKFLKSAHTSENPSTSEFLHPALIQFSEPQNQTETSNIKLLSSDNEAVDFLTLCTIKQSKMDISESDQINTLYIPVYPSMISDFFDFVVPSEEVLHCLTHLEDIENYEAPYTDSQLYCSNSNSISLNITQQQNALSESKFEDLLDDSSDSIYGNSEQHNIKKETIENRELSAIDRKYSPLGNNKQNSLHENEIEVWEELEPGIFEDILDESSLEENKSPPEIKPKATVDLEPGMFEGIMDQSSNSSDDIKIIEQISEKILSKDKSTNDSVLTLSQALNKVEEIVICNENDSGKLMEEANICKIEKTNNELSSKLVSFNDVKIDNIQLNNIDGKTSTCSGIKINNKDLNETDGNEDNQKSLVKINLDIGDIEWNSDFDEPELKIDPNLSSSKTKSTNCFQLSQPPKETSKASNNNEGWISVKPKMKLNLPVNKNSGSLAKKLSSIRSSTPKSNRVAAVYFEDIGEFEEDMLLFGQELRSNYFPKSKKKLDMSEPNTSNNGNEVTFEQKSKSSLNQSTVSNRSISVSLQNSEKESSGKNCEELNSSKLTELDQSEFDEIIAPRNYVNRQEKNKDVLTSDEDRNRKKKRKRIKKCVNEFLDNEAEVSSDNTISDDESSDIMDDSLQNFVSHTQNISDAVDMRAHYLQSLRSPANKPGKFFFRKPEKHIETIDLYSQSLSQENDTYINDSFCVSGNEENSETEENSFGYRNLEKTEKKIKEMKRKRCDSEEEVKKKKRKRRVFVLESSISSGDEAQMQT
ncbi:DEAD-box ATP-dependent DNA helicase Fancm [Prorops nasuta]|uniref:DEAD-box ATP-dependent DNA helicase Fancm n=1 Tax=Prorops nasuta TaxID=863751 RepID=UPI0034CDF3B2